MSARLLMHGQIVKSERGVELGRHRLYTAAGFSERTLVTFRTVNDIHLGERLSIWEDGETVYVECNGERYGVQTLTSEGDPAPMFQPRPVPTAPQRADALAAARALGLTARFESDPDGVHVAVLETRRGEVRSRFTGTWSFVLNELGLLEDVDDESYTTVAGTTRKLA